MADRFVAIWFRHLVTDWFIRKQPELKNIPFVFAAPTHGKMLVTAASIPAEQQGISAGTAVADAKAIVPDIQVFDEIPGKAEQLLRIIGEWCIRYSPIVAIDLPDGLILNAGGCAHLWNGEKNYLREIVTKFRASGYDVRAAIADTIGAAWAVSRYGSITPLIESGEQMTAILPLPPIALRLEQPVIIRLQKLGLHQVNSFINMPRSVLRRRFGEGLLLRLGQALGSEFEVLTPLQEPSPYEERLPCPEPIRTYAGIEVAIQRLLEAICTRLKNEDKGLRTARLTCYRVDDKILQTEIGTNRASHNATHLFKLFELKIETIRPGFGIELFLIEAIKVEELSSAQEKLWASAGLGDHSIAELLDRIEGKIGTGKIHRYLPEEHYWPERSIKPAASLEEFSSATWQSDRPRPVKLLAIPESIEVTAPIPDYPPMLFRYKGKLHEIKKADGPERIEREWWLENGEHRDYYTVEDAAGQRYWLFRSGHYSGDSSQWFIHGFFS